MSDLISIQQHEAKFWEEYKPPVRESPSGIACPTCGDELFVDNAYSLLSEPPQSPVRCPKCNYRGSIH